MLDAQGNYRYVVDNSNAAVQALRTDTDQLTEVFQYSVSDGNGKIVTATFTVIIHGRNDTLLRPTPPPAGNYARSLATCWTTTPTSTATKPTAIRDGTGGGQQVPTAAVASQQTAATTATPPCRRFPQAKRWSSSSPIRWSIPTA
ncbi:VCBS domain-containing protein [Pseudomonas kermanshahensis]|uniref:VCBS domain-containing protein n=1 Tax=Pseudomonas kermanshahensis TaxID=2745482 RepID=UPI003B8A8ADF